MSYIALVDCNNFFVSCERVFNPKLRGRPVVVGSNNGGCIVARSQEAKALGIPMGAPLFQWREKIERHGVVVCSSNFALYGDLSHRVMETLAYFCPDLEIYSVDEAFLRLDEPAQICHQIRQKVAQWTGIPVSIGIAKTKTLAKVANQIAKQSPDCRGICQLDRLVDDFPVEKIWGIGWRIADFLKKRGIFTAGDLIAQEDVWIKKHLSVTGLRMVWELRGIPCLELDDTPSPKQSIMTSRSFKEPITDKETLRERITGHVARGAEKLREEGGRASWLQLFIMTSPHKENYYGNRVQVVFPEPTHYTPTMLSYAHAAFEQIFRAGYDYKRGGVLLGGIVDATAFQRDLFAQPHDEKEEDVMSLMDGANRKFGYPILRFASQGSRRKNSRDSRLRSARFTTRWDELLTIRI